MTTHTGGGSTAGQLAKETGTLAPWASGYVGEMLGRGQALANQPYTAYTGPIAAGQSQLQGQAFGGLGSLQTPTATTAGSFTGQAYEPLTAQQLASGQMPTLSSPTNVVQQYMNPYLKGALAPQYEAARRQNEIQQQELQGQYTKAGAYGGGRQAIAEAELQRGLLDRMSGITGQGYEQAYNQASNLFNQDRGYGLQALQAQMAGGDTQRDIQQEGIAAQISQFADERDDPYKKLQFQQSMLQDLPIDQIQRDYIPQSDIAKWLGYGGQAADIWKSVSAARNPPSTTLPPSDIRLKENITKVGQVNKDIGLYTWKWNEKGKEIAGDTPEFGVLAQEVMATMPNAVSFAEDGYLRVDYNKIVQD